MWAPNKAGAALVQFPTTSLRNNYFLVRNKLPLFMQHTQTLMAYLQAESAPHEADLAFSES